MDQSKIEQIIQLMEELREEMQPSSDELGERLGRPKVEAVSIQSDEPMDGDVAMDGELDPDEKLKDRIMKMRG